MPKRDRNRHDRRVEFPVPSRAPVSGLGPVDPTIAEHPPTILLVDDEDLVRGLTERLLARLGYAVHAAGNGPEALVLAGELAAVDLVLTDVRMPEMSGPELASQLALVRPGTRVLYMSGWIDEEHLDGPCVQKPFTPAGLADAVAAALAA